MDFDTRLYRWHALSQMKATIDEPYRYWIHLPGSLTKALRERSDAFSVEVVSQEHLILSQPIDVFGQRSGLCAYFSRKVVLKHGDTPWVAAHTLVPEASLRNGLGQLTRLKNKPLGELLFAGGPVRKDMQQVCHSDGGWGRRARYWLHHQPLLVSEFFLPELIRYESERTASLHQTHSS